jgi:nucleotide-binding universal stress UspA family protein
MQKVKFLVATDGSDHSLKTLEKAIELAIPLKAEITVLSVVPNVPIYVFPEGFSTEEFLLIEKKLEKKTEELLAQAEQKFKENGIKVDTIMGKGNPADFICKVAEEGDYDLVILGSRGLGGFKQLILGSVSNKVVQFVKKSVLIVK